ncbi:hypothetical protein FKW77_008945 [Venturia effusa]|uniref:histone acetyltransferase n=1 Tax=Venturia effusa TaxID=50376 RepID=A0A517L7X9_9PEZI|nr:hypothetical protein FKW77_008945 [Venturia effusa]
MVSTRSQKGRGKGKGKAKAASAQTNPHPNSDTRTPRKPINTPHVRDHAPKAPQPSGPSMASTPSLADNAVPTITNTKDTTSTANGIQALANREKKESQDPTVKEVVLGNLWVKPWYKSSYAEEITGRPGSKGWVDGLLERLYVCQWCFKYTVDLAAYLGHTKICSYQDIEGTLGSAMYSTDDFSIYEVDGEEHKLYTQNLSLFAKLFLETKSVFYDTTTFLYYLLYYRDPLVENSKPQVVGFFSKEKLSWDNNNLACILVFPPWQKRGFGQVLMGVSYELAKREGRLGGPEKPLSELGRQAYVRYWSGVIARNILSLPLKKMTTVQQICDETFIVQEDIVATLKEMGILEKRKKGGASVVINKARIREWATLNRVSLDSPVDPDAFDWPESGEEDEEEESD